MCGVDGARRSIDPMNAPPKGWPILAMMIAAAAVAAMIALGFWQLERRQEKAALLTRYDIAAGQAAVTYPAVPVAGELPLFRRSRLHCIKVTGWRSISGSSAAGAAGYAHLAYCQTGGGEGPGAVVAAGWSKRPDHPDWRGGIVSGIIAPHKPELIKLVATTPVAGLQLLARPSPASIPNNHLFYAIQWFIFAAAAGIISALAIRQKMRK